MSSTPTNQQILDRLKTAYYARIAGESGTVSAYSVAGRSVQKLSMAELRAEIQHYETLVERESSSNSATVQAVKRRLR